MFRRRVGPPGVGLALALFLAAFTVADVPVPVPFDPFRDAIFGKRLYKDDRSLEIEDANQPGPLRSTLEIASKTFNGELPLNQDGPIDDDFSRDIPSLGGLGGQGVVVSPSGRNVFVVNFSNQVSSYTVDPATGDLNPTPGGLYPTGDNPQAGTVDPTGRFLYVPNVFDDTISAYAIDLQTSALTTIGTFPAGDGPQAIASSRRFVFVSDLKLDSAPPYTVTVLRIDQPTGALTPVPGSPFPIGGAAPFQMALTPEGRFLYVGVQGLAVDALTGALTPVPGPPPSVTVSGLAMHPSLPYLFVGTDTDVRTFRFDYFTGALTAVGSPAASDPFPIIAVRPDGESLYATGSGTLSVRSYTIDPETGQPSEVGTPAVLRDVASSLSVRSDTAERVAGLGVAFSRRIEARGGVLPYAFSLAGGALPAGLSLDGPSGAIQGTPTAVGVSTFLVQVKDALGNVSHHASTIQVIAPPAAPSVPSDVTATPLSPTSVEVAWRDNAGQTGTFHVAASIDGGPFIEVAAVSPFRTSQVVRNLSPATAFDFRVRASSAGGTSAFSGTARASTTASVTGPCVPSATAGCLVGGRFRLEAIFQTSKGEMGDAQVVSLTPDTAYLWFFAESNVETVVKVLNGCGIGGHYWVFAGGLTNVHVVLKVTDTLTGAVREYENPIGTAFIPIQETTAFGTCGAAPASLAGESSAFEPPHLSEEAVSWRLPSASATCTPGDTAMCLDGARFKVEATYRTSDGRSGAAHMVQITPDTGYMWFFNSANVEAVVKVLNACSVNQHQWVFAGGLTSVNVVVTVTDTQTGTVKQYTNPQGMPFQPVQDTAAFVCP